MVGLLAKVVCLPGRGVASGRDKAATHGGGDTLLTDHHLPGRMAGAVETPPNVQERQGHHGGGLSAPLALARAFGGHRCGLELSARTEPQRTECLAGVHRKCLSSCLCRRDIAGG